MSAETLGAPPRAATMLRKSRLLKYCSLLLLLLSNLLGCSAHIPVANNPDDFNRFTTAAQQNYPDNLYLSAIGEGRSLVEAQETAQGGIAKIFSARIEEDLLVNQESLSINEKDMQSSYLSRSVLVSARSDIKGIEVPETLYSAEQNLYFALAVLDRNEAEGRWLDVLRAHKSRIANLEFDLGQADLPAYRVVYKLRELHWEITQHNQLIGKLQVVKPDTGYRIRRDDTARHLRIATQAMSFFVTAADAELKLWIENALNQEGMPIKNETIADIVIEAELRDLPLARLDEWFITQSSLMIKIISSWGLQPKIVEWKPKGTSIRQEDAEKRMRGSIKKTIQDDLFGVMIDELNEG